MNWSRFFIVIDKPLKRSNLENHKAWHFVHQRMNATSEGCPQILWIAVWTTC
ncbi:hypothetical protein PAMC26510_09280 [Caballeronia sordidicola]|uniref:Uncharacterized protein n=1 Tax=Caballeronia sordidicola TaxID=196367 RepID=A0A242N137_CABSO|nr:hypothetical protein PAMC26510_09280 [Caballeronia sordidicola]